MFNDELTQVPTDQAAIEAAIASASEALEVAEAEGDDREKLRLLGYLGTAERIVGDYARAIAHLEGCLRLAESLGPRRAQTVARIRLGEVYRCADRLEESERVLRQAVEEIDEIVGEPLRDFALQHLGKCLTDQGRFDEAIVCFDEALELRRSKSDRELVSSTEMALAKARRLRAAALE